MDGAEPGSRRVGRTLLLLGALALLAAVPRFGQRENEGAAFSDSDYYLDMAAVFAGQAEAFEASWARPGHPGGHHYARPLLPWLAGHLGSALGGHRRAFSALNVLGAWSVAAALYLVLLGAAPGVRHPWLPSALFLTGFPQVDWGYHVLTDTFGYATAFLASLLAARLVTGGAKPRTDAGLPLALAGLFALQAAAFLTRETGWFTPVVVVALLVGGAVPRRRRRLAAVVLVVTAFAYLPEAVWLARHDLRPVAIRFAPGAWLDPGYVADFLVKSAVAFHLVWALALVGALRGGLRRVPPVLWGWGVAGLLYMAAGYAHNSLDGVGYPLRLTYALFPVVYVLAAGGLEAVVERRGRGALASGRRHRLAALLLVALNVGVGVAGTSLDRGRSGVTVPSLLRGDRGPP